MTFLLLHNNRPSGVFNFFGRNPMLSPDSVSSRERAPAHVKEVAAPVSAAVTKQPARYGRLLDQIPDAARKEYPITTGVLDYFPDAVTMVSHISFIGNNKHNPGQPLHWSRNKSADHEDCIARHTIQRDKVEDNVLHAANRAWRALAELQIMLEERYSLEAPRGARD